MTQNKEFTRNQKLKIENWIYDNLSNLPSGLKELVESFETDNIENKLDKIVIFKWNDIEYTMLDIYNQFINMVKRRYPNSSIKDNLFENELLINELKKFIIKSFVYIDDENIDSIITYINDQCEYFIEELEFEDRNNYINFAYEDKLWN